MDISTLRVFNSLYKLGVTEEEFREVAEEQKYKDRTGLYIHKTIECKQNKYLLCVSHDQNHKIIINSYVPNVKPKTRVLLKTLITFPNVPQQIYTLHGIVQYRALDTDIKHTADNLEELKDRIVERFIDKYPKELGEAYEDVYADSYHRRKNKTKRPALVTQQLKAIYWLLGEEFNEKEDVFSRVNVPRVIKVWQRGNSRLALIQIKENWEAKRGMFIREEIDRVIYEIKTFTPSDWRYNYVCADREISYVKDEGEVWLDDDLFEKVRADELFAICDMREEGVLLLDTEEYQKIKSKVRVALINKRRIKEEKEAKDILKSNIKKQFNRGKITRHGITFTEKSVSYEDIKFSGDKVGKYLVTDNIIYLETPNFNEIFEGYVEFILSIKLNYDYYPYEKNLPTVDNKEILKVGDIKMELEPIKRRGFIINGYRISKEDVEFMVKQSIKFSKQSDYDKYLKHTSRVCLKLQKALKEGIIKFELDIDKTEDNALTFDDSLNVRERKNRYFNEETTKMLLALPIIREKEKNFVIIKNEKHSVKNVKSLLNLENTEYLYRYEGHLQKTIKQLYKSISKIYPQDIADIISKGQKEYGKIVRENKKKLQEKIARSKEFLAHAVRLTKAKKVKGGYIVKGVSGRYYFVENDEGKAWTIKNGKQDKYLCLVDLVKKDDEAEGEAGNNDSIARRLLMLSKDKKVAKEIWDKGDKQDKLWLELQDKKEEAVI